MRDVKDIYLTRLRHQIFISRAMGLIGIPCLGGLLWFIINVLIPGLDSRKLPNSSMMTVQIVSATIWISVMIPLIISWMTIKRHAGFRMNYSCRCDLPDYMFFPSTVKWLPDFLKKLIVSHAFHKLMYSGVDWAFFRKLELHSGRLELHIPQSRNVNSYLLNLITIMGVGNG